MKIVTVNTKLLKAYTQDPEFLHNAKRPCVLIMRLKYKGHHHKFAVPIRSNIPAASPKIEFFGLPPRPSTRTNNRHGIHYIKMFPIANNLLQKYHTEGNMAATLMKAIIDKNEKTIIQECQSYLTEYEKGNRPKYATDIDFLLEQLEKIK